MNSKGALKYFKIFIVVLVMLLVMQKVMRRRREVSLDSEEFNQEMKIMADISREQYFPGDNFVPVFSQPGYKREERETDGIPLIVHQIWDTYEVPDRFANWIKTWKDVNPSWQHWFWSLADARKLIATHYSKYLSLYDSYPSSVFRADAARYFILHKYGGVYADLDMSSIRPLENWTYPYDCIVSEEPHEHTFIIRQQNGSSILNGFIACIKEHPFLESTIDSLMEAAGNHFGDYLRATGPMFFTDVCESFIKKFKRTSSNQPDLLVVPPRYFFPTYDRSESDTLSSKCSPRFLILLTPRGRVLCRDLILRNFANEPDKAAYTNHDWLHSYMFGEDFRTKNTVHISKIMPEVHLASNDE